MEATVARLIPQPAATAQQPGAPRGAIVAARDHGAFESVLARDAAARQAAAGPSGETARARAAADPFPPIAADNPVNTDASSQDGNGKPSSLLPHSATSDSTPAMSPVPVGGGVSIAAEGLRPIAPVAGPGPDGGAPPPAASIDPTGRRIDASGTIDRASAPWLSRPVDPRLARTDGSLARAPDAAAMAPGTSPVRAEAVSGQSSRQSDGDRRLGTSPVTTAETGRPRPSEIAASSMSSQASTSARSNADASSPLATAGGRGPVAASEPFVTGAQGASAHADAGSYPPGSAERAAAGLSAAARSSLAAGGAPAIDPAPELLEAAGPVLTAEGSHRGGFPADARAQAQAAGWSAPLGDAGAGTRLHLVTQGDGRFALQLRPADLGRIDMQFEIGDDGMRVVVAVERQATADLIRRHDAVLQGLLREAGFGAVDVTVRQDDAGSAGADRPLFEDHGAAAGSEAGSEDLDPHHRSVGAEATSPREEPKVPAPGLLATAAIDLRL